MKAIENKKGASKVLCISLILLLMGTVLGCSKDDGGSDFFITAKASTSSFEQLNTCDISSCCLATEFDFNVVYEASSGIEIDKIIFDLKWSDGDTETGVKEAVFSDSGTSVVYNWCYKFGDDDWVEITHRLISKQGITSNTSVVRLNKPEGAN